MFQLISADKLVIGKKYGIVYKDDDYSGVYKEMVDYGRQQFLVFNKVYNNIEEIAMIYPFYFTKYDLYYEFISEHPQWNMERRAVNLIVRQLIGDECFEW
jgi:hypothetical protein